MEPLALQPLLRLALPVIVSVAVLAAIRPNARSKTRADPPRLQARGFHVTALPALEARLLLWFPELLLLLMMALMLMLLARFAAVLVSIVDAVATPIALAVAIPTAIATAIATAVPITLPLPPSLLLFPPALARGVVRVVRTAPVAAAASTLRHPTRRP